MTAIVNATVQQERDLLSRPLVYAGAFVLALMLVIGAVLTWLIERHAPVHLGSRRAGAVAETPREINMIDQTLFSAHVPSRGNLADKQRALQSYEWVDRNRRIARIPVARAMELLVKRGHVE